MAAGRASLVPQRRLRAAGSGRFPLLELAPDSKQAVQRPLKRLNVHDETPSTNICISELPRHRSRAQMRLRTCQQPAIFGFRLRDILKGTDRAQEVTHGFTAAWSNTPVPRQRRRQPLCTYTRWRVHFQRVWPGPLAGSAPCSTCGIPSSSTLTTQKESAPGS